MTHSSEKTGTTIAYIGGCGISPGMEAGSGLVRA
jgi:hypothetical protein